MQITVSFLIYFFFERLSVEGFFLIVLKKETKNVTEIDRLRGILYVVQFSNVRFA